MIVLGALGKMIVFGAVFAVSVHCADQSTEGKQKYKRQKFEEILCCSDILDYCSKPYHVTFIA